MKMNKCHSTISIRDYMKFTIYSWVLLISALRVLVKDFSNKNVVLKI